MNVLGLVDQAFLSNVRYHSSESLIKTCSQVFLYMRNPSWMLSSNVCFELWKPFTSDDVSYVLDFFWFFAALVNYVVNELIYTCTLHKFEN